MIQRTLFFFFVLRRIVIIIIEIGVFNDSSIGDIACHFQLGGGGGWYLHHRTFRGEGSRTHQLSLIGDFRGGGFTSSPALGSLILSNNNLVVVATRLTFSWGGRFVSHGKSLVFR